MSTFTDETDARIKTQRMLREASESLRKKALAHRSDARKHKMEALKFSRMSRPKQFNYWNALYDKNFSSHCLMKTTIRYKGNKNKLVHNWVGIVETEDAPIHLREQHIVEIWLNILTAKTPRGVIPKPSGLFISRHALERVVMRAGADSIGEIGEHLWPFISVFQYSETSFKSGEGRLLISNKAYCPIQQLDTEHIPNSDLESKLTDSLVARDQEPVLVTSYIDKENWSVKNRERISTLYDWLEANLSDELQCHLKDLGLSHQDSPNLPVKSQFVVDVPESLFKGHEPIDVKHDDVRLYAVLEGLSAFSHITILLEDLSNMKQDE